MSCKCKTALFLKKQRLHDNDTSVGFPGSLRTCVNVAILMGLHYKLDQVFITSAYKNKTYKRDKLTLCCHRSINVLVADDKTIVFSLINIASVYPLLHSNYLKTRQSFR